MNSVKFRLLLAAACIFLIQPLIGQETSSVMEQILVISIDANVKNNAGKTIWGMEHNTLTISGRSVHIKLEGGNIEIFSNLTPYAQSDDEFLLVAQGEIWIKEEGSEEKTHYSGMDSVSVKLGEKAIFFPLGMAEDSLHPNYTLEIEIGVNLYTNLQKKSTKRL